MSADDLLFAERSTTSLYTRAGNADEQHVLPLSLSKATYSTLDEVSRTLGAPPAPTTRTAAPEIVVQVRKRNGKTDLLIDGYVSTGKSAGGNVTDHHLVAHTGMHEDVETRTRVFSPIAIVSAIEDGQHAYQRVSVAVIYNYGNYATVLEPSTVLTEAPVPDHRVTDVRCSVVRAPYPLPYPAPPTVVIYDDMQQTQAHAIKTSKLAWSKNLLAVATFMQGLVMNLGIEDVFSVLKYASVTAAGVAAAGTVSVSLYAAGWALPALVQLTALPSWALYAQAFLYGEYSTLLEPVLVAIGTGAYKWATDAPPPDLRKTRFTLPELAMAIEALAARRAPANRQPPEAIRDPAAHQSTQFKRELLIWHWLADRGLADMPPIDTSQLVATAEYTARLHLRITVDDALACDGKSHIHNLHCGRDDGPLLAAAAAGTFEDLSRLFAAIKSLEDVLTEVTANGAQPVLDLWCDRAFYDPMLYTSALVRTVAADLGANWQVGATAVEAVKSMRLRGAARKAKKAYIEDWQDSSDPNLEERPAILKKVLANLKTKLVAPLFGGGSAAAKLYMDMNAALEDRRAIDKANPPVEWVRQLPQRTLSTYGSYLFSAVRDTGSAYVDVDAGSSLARLYTEYHDAAKWLSVCMKGSRLALKRLVPEWEASSETRIRMLCMCTAIDVDDGAVPYAEPVSYATLSLMTPIDIRFSGALASPTEHSQRRIRMIAKRTKEDHAPSVLEALKLEHTDDYLLACLVYGDLWADELVALYKTEAHKHAEMLEMASARAATRLRSAGKLLLELVASKRAMDDTIEFDDVALNGTDIALMATQPGRDARRLVSRMLFSQNYLAVRSVLTAAMRDAARAAVRTAAAFERRVPFNLPHEACASLFGDRVDGLVAFLRAKQLSNDPAVLEAMAGAYPSVHLLALDADVQEQYLRIARDRKPPERSFAPTEPTELVRAMRFRMASLRTDFASVDAVAASPQSITVDRLAKRLATTSIGEGDHFSFYVPFGFGDARPPPTLPSCAAPLFGTVPVYGPALVEAFQSIALAATRRDEPEASAERRVLSVRLEPAFDCLEPPTQDRGAEETESVHPNVVQALRDKGGTVVVRYTASRMPPSPPRAPASATAADEVPTYAATLSDAVRAASAHACSAETSRLGLAVSSIAWNAERVVQAVVAALASADDEGAYDAVELTFEMPRSDTRTSHLYAKPPNPLALAQTARKLQQHAVMWDAIQKGTVERQRELVEAALKQSRELDPTDSVLGSAAHPQRQLWQSIVETPELDRDFLKDFAKRKEAFLSLFSDEVLAELTTVYVNAKRAAAEMYAWATGDNNPLPSDDDLLKEAIKGVSELVGHVTEVEALQPPNFYFPPEWRAVAPLEPPPRDPTDQAHPLLAALGVGMALLAPQLEPLPVTCRAVRPAAALTRAVDAVIGLTAAFENCAAVRLGEACLLASRHV